MARVLITRISSFGDVAMLVPVIFSVAAKYPQDRFVVLTRKAFAPLFENLGFNIGVKVFDANRHGGVWGLFRLLRGITGGYTHVADMHDVLRTKVIRTYLFLLGKKVAHIDKGRREKNQMIATKQTTPELPHTIDRYTSVLEKLGFSVEMVFNNYFEFKERSLYPLRTIVSEKTGKWVGIAPFSKHREKMYPLEKMEKIVASLVKDPSVTVFLFGAGSKERTLLQKWEDKFPQVVNLSGKINLENELLLMSFLDVMVSMDSANMHLASLVKVPCVSVWGATHPALGFSGFKQSLDNLIQSEIECRPCSVFGEASCAKGDLACLENIRESVILDKVRSFLKVDEKVAPERKINENITPSLSVEIKEHINKDTDLSGEAKEDANDDVDSSSEKDANESTETTPKAELKISEDVHSTTESEEKNTSEDTDLSLEEKKDVNDDVDLSAETEANESTDSMPKAEAKISEEVYSTTEAEEKNTSEDTDLSGEVKEDVNDDVDLLAETEANESTETTPKAEAKISEEVYSTTEAEEKNTSEDTDLSGEVKEKNVNDDVDLSAETEDDANKDAEDTPAPDKKERPKWYI